MENWGKILKHKKGVIYTIGKCKAFDLTKTRPDCAKPRWRVD